MKTLLTILLSLAPAQGQTTEIQTYSRYLGQADLVVIARLEHAELEAFGGETRWKVTYRISEVLKGSYDGPRLTLSFDASLLAKSDRSGRAAGDDEGRLVLFLDEKPDGSFSYAGPPLNSTLARASKSSIEALKRAIAQAREIEAVRHENVFEEYLTPTTVAGCIALAVVLAIAIIAARRNKRTN